MHLLTREVSPVRRPYRSLLAIFAVSAIFLAGNMTGFYRGLAIGERQAAGVEEVQTASVCGITDPVACVTSVLESVADLFRPEMPVVMTVTTTATIVEAPTCGAIMDTFHKLPRERVLEMPGLLEQVEECKAHYRSSGID